MKQQEVVRDFKELKYLLKSGHAPVKDKAVKKTEKPTAWIICYGKQVLEYNLPYPVAVEKIKVYKRFGHQFPDKSKFSIKPYEI